MERVQSTEQGRGSWATTAGIALLAISSFAGCDAPRVGAGIPPETALNNQPIASIKVTAPEELITARAINPDHQPLLDQTVRLEKALNIIRSHSDSNGWRGTRELRTHILGEFESTEQALLGQIRVSEPGIARSDLERLYQGVHTVHGLFDEDGLGYNRIAYDRSAMDGTMSHVYGLHAQLILTRIHLSEVQ